MSLVACRECKAKISSDADKCPQCGAQQHASRLKILVVGVFAIAVAFGVAGVVTAPDEVAHQAAPAVKTPQQIKDEADFQHVVRVARSVKAASKNPDSFKLDGAVMTPEGAVCLNYRATNSFNAVVPGFASERGGKISTAAGEWNKYCADKLGKDYGYIRNAL